MQARKSWLWWIICGFCMGSADVVPGISGGTIAFIMGFYERLVESIKTLNLRALIFLCKGKFRLLFNYVAWPFLLSLFLGISFAFFSLAQLFVYFLNHEFYCSLLYSGFFGLIVGSFYFCITKIPKWGIKEFFWLFIGVVIAYFLSGSGRTSAVATHEPISGIDLKLVGCGMLAICAMLLPGISGSYMLVILGVYPIVITALAKFTSSFDYESFMILANLGIGIIFGALLFSHVVSWLFKHYYGVTLAMMTGFMMGTLKTVWPFSNADPSGELWVSLIIAIIGFVLVILLESSNKFLDRIELDQYI